MTRVTVAPSAAGCGGVVRVNELPRSAACEDVDTSGRIIVGLASARPASAQHAGQHYGGRRLRPALDRGWTDELRFIGTDDAAETVSGRLPASPFASRLPSGTARGL